MMSASCLGPRLPTAVTNGWFLPVQAGLCNAFLERHNHVFLLLHGEQHHYLFWVAASFKTLTDNCCCLPGRRTFSDELQTLFKCWLLVLLLFAGVKDALCSCCVSTTAERLRRLLTILRRMPLLPWTNLHLSVTEGNMFRYFSQVKDLTVFLIMSGCLYPCQNCSQGPPAKKTRTGSLLNRPSCAPGDPVGQGTELNWTMKSVFYKFC